MADECSKKVRTQEVLHDVGTDALPKQSALVGSAAEVDSSHHARRAHLGHRLHSARAECAWMRSQSHEPESGLCEASMSRPCITQRTSSSALLTCENDEKERGARPGYSVDTVKAVLSPKAAANTAAAEPEVAEWPAGKRSIQLWRVGWRSNKPFDGHLVSLSMATSSKRLAAKFNQTASHARRLHVPEGCSGWAGVDSRGAQSD